MAHDAINDRGNNAMMLPTRVDDEESGRVPWPISL
jgi:hypothetical protein